MREPLTSTPACPECGSPMVLRSTEKFRYANGQPRRFFGCSHWPVCSATHGAHPDGTPLGIPADAETKSARMEAHAEFDWIWQARHLSRNAAYRWMARAMGLSRAQAHIGGFTKEQCRKLVRLVQEEFGQKEDLQDAYDFTADGQS